MFVIHKTFVIVVLISLVFSIDPDIDLCNDLTIDAASPGEDDRNYAFKGQHFWTFDTEDGFGEDFAQPISERWVGLPTPIDASFIIDEEIYRLSMIFIVKQNWYLYKQSRQQANGSTTRWPYFPSGRINAAFTAIRQMEPVFSSNPIIFIHDNCTQYSKYVFKRINNPTLIKTDKTYVLSSGFLEFLVKDGSKDVSNTLKDWMPITAAMTTRKNHFIGFGKSQYCSKDYPNIDFITCERQPSERFFHCPRMSRPMTTSSSTDKTVIAEAGDGPNQTITSTEPHKDDKPNVLVWVLLIFMVFVLCVVGISTVSAILVKKKYDKSHKISSKNKHKSQSEIKKTSPRRSDFYTETKNVESVGPIKSNLPVKRDSGRAKSETIIIKSTDKEVKNDNKDMKASKRVESVPKTKVNKETVEVISDTPVVAEKIVDSDTTEEVEADQMLERLKNKSQESLTLL